MPDTSSKKELHPYLLSSSKNFLGVNILRSNGRTLMSRRSLSLLTRISAFDSKQHSRSILSVASLQMDSFVRGWTTMVLVTKVANPEINAFNWADVSLPWPSRIKGTSRYSFKRGGETYRSVSANAFFKAFSGIPPKTKAETRTPVSITTLFLPSVGLSPYQTNSTIYILHG